MYNGNRKDFSRSSLSTPSSRDSTYLPPNGMQMVPLPTTIPGQGMQTIPGIPVQPKSDPTHNSISNLQTMARKLNCVIPEYTVERVGGQDHAPVFQAVCSWNSSHMKTDATGSSKNDARRKAALQMIGLLRAQGVFVNGIPPKTSNPYDRDRKPIIKHPHSSRTPYFHEPNSQKRQGPHVKPEDFVDSHSELQSQPRNPSVGLESGATSYPPPNGHRAIYPGPHQSSQRGGHHFSHHSGGRHPVSQHPGNEYPSSQHANNNQPGAYHSNSSGTQEMRHPRLSEYRFDSSAGTSDNRLNEIPIPRTKQDPRPAHSGYPLPPQQMDLHHSVRDGPPRHDGTPHHRARDDRPPPHQMDPRHRPHAGHVVHHSRLDTQLSKSKQSSMNALDGGTIVASGHRSSSNSANSHSRNSMTNASDGAALTANETLPKPVSTKLVIPKIPLSAPAPVEMDVKRPAVPSPKRDPRLALRRRSKQGVSAEGAKAVSPPAKTPTGGLEETDLSSGNAVENSYRPRAKEVKIENSSAAAEKKNGSTKEVEIAPAKDSVEKGKVAAEKSTAVLSEAKKPVESNAPSKDEGAQKKKKSKDNVAAAKESSSENKSQQATGSGNLSPDETMEQTKAHVPIRKRNLARFRAQQKAEVGENAMQTERVVKQKVGPERQNEKGTGDEMQVDVQEGGNEMQEESESKNGSPDFDNEAVEEGEIKTDGNASSPVTISMPPKVPLSAVSVRRKLVKSESLQFGNSEALRLGDSRLIVPAKKRPRANFVVPTRVILWVFCDSREARVIDVLRGMTYGLYSEMEMYIYAFGDTETNLRNSERIKVFTVPVSGSEDKSTLDLHVAMGYEAGRHSLMLDKLRKARVKGNGTVADLTLSRIVILSAKPGFAAVGNANTDVLVIRDLRKYVDDIHRRFCEVHGGDVCVSVNTEKAKDDCASPPSCD